LPRRTGGHRQVLHPDQAWHGDRGGQAERRRAAGDSVEEAERLIHEAVALHLQSLRAHGEPGATTVGGRRHRRHGARGLILRADLP